MSSPKHAAVRNEISMQLRAPPRYHRNGEWQPTESDSFVGEVPRRSSQECKEEHHVETGGASKNSSSNKIIKTACVIVIMLFAVACGFLLGFFTHYAITTLHVETAMSMSSRETMHNQAVGSVSQDMIQEFESLHVGQQCALGSPSCTVNLTRAIVDQLSAMGYKVSTSTYNVLVSYPNMTRASGLRLKDAQGSTLQTVSFYGGEDAGPGYQQLPPRGLSAAAVAPQGDVLLGTGGDSVIVTSDGSSSSMPVYTPYTASGRAEGDLVYINYGSEADFATIANLGVNVSGKVALTRQGQSSAVSQAEIAASHGISGLLLYPDPSDMTFDMPMTSVMTPDMSAMFGDPLTPGCPAVDGIYRSSMNQVDLPSIPVQPVSMATAAMLLSNLTGIPAEGAWVGGLNVSYHLGLTGETRQSWFVQMDVHNDVIQKPIYDVIATIEGSENPDQYVLLGGHFSSMMTSMVTPGSSSTVMEAARVISQMMEDGWMPRRTIMIGFWEGSEFGHSGSTEWAEENRMVLADRAVAYIELGGGGGEGSILSTQASPLLRGLIMDSAEQLGLASMVNLDVLDGSGDYVPFSHMIGIPSARIEIAGSQIIGSNALPAPSGSVMTMSSTQLATHIVLSLADDEVLGLDAPAMADTIMTYVDNLNSVIGDMMSPDSMHMTMLRSAASDFMSAVQDLQGVIGSDTIGNSPVTMTMVNSRLMYMERSFIDTGLSGTMGSVLYGLQATNTFSTISGMMRNGTGTVSMAMMQQTVSRLQCTIQSATQSIGMSLS